MNIMGKFLIYSGLFLILIGGIIILLTYLPIKFGKLPGDIYIEGKIGTFYFPIVTSIIVSLILTVILNLLFFLVSFFNR